MKWVLIYIIMTTNYGTTSVVQEFEDETACNFALDFLGQSLRPLTEDRHGIEFEPTTVSMCIPKRSESR